MNSTTATTSTQRAYITAYQNVIMAVSDVERFVSSSLRTQVDSLEASMTDIEIESLRNIARRGM